MSEEIILIPGTTRSYVKQGDIYICSDCNATILSVTVTHSIHLPGGLLGGIAGFGEVVSEEVPYCPNCDSKPNPQGKPVYYDYDLHSYVPIKE